MPVAVSAPAQAVSDPLNYGPISWENASEDEAYAVGYVFGRAHFWEQDIGKEFREKCERLFKQYRGFREFADAWVTTQNPRDRDAVLYDAKKHWGAHLHIPLSFRTIETIVPRAIAHLPKLLYMPRDEQWRKNVETVRLLIDKQQAQIDIDLPFQAVMRSGRIYGIGAGKSYWRTEVKRRRRMERHTLAPSLHILGEPKREVTFDDPMFEDVDIFDLMWDPYGSSVETCEWMIHRRWMSTQAVLQRVESGTWATPSAQKLDEEKIRALAVAGLGRYGEVWNRRMELSGFTSFGSQKRGDHPHELLEYHDGEQVISVLDGQVLVQVGENPCGDMPFQVYRPTPINKQFVGIGDLEPLEHLQRELDTLRSQRRDSATMALAGGYAFDSAAIDEEDLSFGPNFAIPVRNARPQDAIFPINHGEVPGSSWQEEAAILRDIESVSGNADALNNSPGGTEGTATEASLVQAALSRRIALSGRRFEIEVVRHVARQFLYLDQRMIVKNRAQLVVPGENVSPQQAQEDPQAAGSWRYFPVGPGELEGEYEIEPEGGSMAERNMPQDRADAQAILNNLAHDWYINPTKARLRAMELMGIKHPQSWLRDPTPSVPMPALRFLIQGGVDPDLVVKSVLRAREVSAPQEGPSASQITEMFGSEGTQ